MNSQAPSAATVAEKLGDELQQYAVVSGYLFVCFSVLILYKAAVLRGQGVSYVPDGLAAIVKALVLGKFVLLGRAVRVGDRYERRSFVHVIAQKSLLFLIMLFILSFVEEAVVGIVHGRSVSASLAEVTGGTLLEIFAKCVILLLILIPYLTFAELNQVLSGEGLRQILFEQRAGPQSGRRQD